MTMRQVEWIENSGSLGESCLDRCIRQTGDRATCIIACRPSGYIDVGQSGIVAKFSPIPWMQSPPPGSQPPSGPAPTGAPQAQNMQLYVIDPSTGQGAPYGEPQSMTHTQVRANIEAAARQPNAPMMGYGEAGTGVPNYGIYDTSQTPPVWDKPMIQAWYFDDAAKLWVPWPAPAAPIDPVTLRQLIEQGVKSGVSVGGGWSAPGASQPLWAYREGQWQVPGLSQLWVLQGAQWVKVGFPVIRTLTGLQKDIEAAVAAGSPPLGFSGDGASEPTFVYDGQQWRKHSAAVEETAAPPGYPSIPGIPAGTPSLPPGISPTIFGVPFPTPAMPGVPVGIVSSAIDSIQKAAVSCPGIATPDGALQHALSAFGVFSALSVAQGLSPDGNLDVLHAELDKLCPQWRGSAPPSPTPPPAQADVSELLGQVALALAGAATAALPGLFARAKETGLPGLAEQIRQYAEQSGTPIPGAEPPPPKEPPPSTPATSPDEKSVTTKKKEKKTNVALVGLGVIVVGLSAWALS